ncbi:MAG TPA: DNA replication/repair protein RecF [Clostridiales bacterium]|nr:DNA replication/repair protein RecF [Clostridiales bacterium]
MYIELLKLVNYRNYNNLKLDLIPGLNVLVGDNAQGKTNILESIFFSCTGKSHRTSRDRELIRVNKEECFILTELQREEGKNVIEIRLKQQGKKIIKINGVAIRRLSELMGNLNVVIFSPEDLRLIKEGPRERRRFMDIQLCQMRPKYLYNLQQYNRILNQRNTLLKKIQTKAGLKKTLSIWDRQLVTQGCNIIKTRHWFLEKLGDIALNLHSDLTMGRETLNIKYVSSIEYNDLYEIEQSFMKVIEKNRERDIMLGSTQKGPHRDDFDIYINELDLKSYGSQGQHRTAALSLKLSGIDIIKEDVGEYPVLLLDDVMSELDTRRQQMLMSNLSRVQSVVTCTDLSWTDHARGFDKKIFHVKQGRVKVKGINKSSDKGF